MVALPLRAFIARRLVGGVCWAAMLLFIPPLPWLRTTTSGAVSWRWRHVFSDWLPIPTKYKTLTRQKTDQLMLCSAIIICMVSGFLRIVNETAWPFYMGPVGWPETSLTTNIRILISQKNEDLYVIVGCSEVHIRNTHLLCEQMQCLRLLALVIVKASWALCRLQYSNSITPNIRSQKWLQFWASCYSGSSPQCTSVLRLDTPLVLRDPPLIHL